LLANAAQAFEPAGAPQRQGRLERENARLMPHHSLGRVQYTILLPVWKGLELSQNGVAVGQREDSHEATQVETGTESADRARGAEGATDRRAMRRA